MNGDSILFAEVPADGEVSETSDGLFIFIPDVQAESDLWCEGHDDHDHDHDGNSGDVAAYLRSLAMVEKPHNILLISHLPLVGYLTAEFAPMTPPMFATSGISCIEYDVNTDKSELLWLKMPSGLPIEHE